MNRQDMGSWFRYLRHSQDGYGEDKGDGPGDEVEVGGLAQQWLVGSAQRLEGGVPGVGQHDEPDDTRHQRVVDDDKDDDTGECLIGATGVGETGGSPTSTRGHRGGMASLLPHGASSMLPRGQETPRALLGPGDTSWHMAVAGWGQK